MIRVSCMQHQRGIGMIEVLIAVLVVSIGFLGMAALQARALSTNNSAMARSMATVASYSILDAMRADLVNAKAGNYNTTVTAGSCSSTTAGNPLATTQLQAWCTELGNTLGGVATTTGNISCTVVGDCKVSIQFDDSRAGQGGSATQQVVTEAGL
ncbi:MAG: type IV pilus modification protein PilV [Rhodanobacteraceae bacterium]|nr:MAG: type IV pilus modification protein PilV [Rhodanobacteraceae bacterium]